MNDIEPKEVFRQIGIDLINEYSVRGGLKPIDWLVIDTPEVSAFIRSIQLHEKTKQELQGVKQELADFRQEVSDVVTSLCNTLLMGSDHSQICEMLSRRFILPEPKPDPLVAALKGVTFDHYPPNDAKTIRAALDARGLEIREKGK